jgi:hypothetical protein
LPDVGSPIGASGGQAVPITLRLKGLPAIEIGCDLATEATEAHEALQLSVVGHMLSPSD